jgi:GDPmannose 4,6-dehydratase
MTKVAFITGINGQDGSYLSELLLSKDYYVYGIIRRMSCINTCRIDNLYANSKFKIYYGDMTDSIGMNNIIKKILDIHSSNIEIFEVYNLAAQSHVKVSYEMSEYTMQVNAIGPLNLLENLKNCNLPLNKIKFYQASTSEMFGDVENDTILNESSPFNPISPYSISKLAAHNTVKMYRNAYKLFACNGILFNHESIRRGETFVTRKIVIAAKKIANGEQEFLELGNLDSYRDWGHASDYVYGMWKILQADKPDDYVLGTGITYKVRDFVEKAFKYHGIDIIWQGNDIDEIGFSKETNKIIVKINPRLFRPLEVSFLKADYSKAKKELNWEPKMNLDDIIQDMNL